MNRPPLVDEVIIDTEWCNLNGYADGWRLELDNMQEALTCEWLIEKGFMPDPTEYGGHEYWDTGMHWYELLWLKEDKTK
jgi:hypothetical protein